MLKFKLGLAVIMVIIITGPTHAAKGGHFNDPHPQILQTPAANGHFHECQFTNITDMQRTVTLNMRDAAGDDQIGGNCKSLDLPPGETAGCGTGDQDGLTIRCEVEWVGEHGDIIASHCITFEPAAGANGYTCSKLE